jgi:hypothetical protein
MTNKKVCIDCGKLFDPVNQMDNKDGDISSVVVCGECVMLLKKRFWNSMKMDITKSTNSNVTIPEEQGKEYELR